MGAAAPAPRAPAAGAAAGARVLSSLRESGTLAVPFASPPSDRSCPLSSASLRGHRVKAGSRSPGGRGTFLFFGRCILFGGGSKRVPYCSHKCFALGVLVSKSLFFSLCLVAFLIFLFLLRSLLLTQHI